MSDRTRKSTEDENRFQRVWTRRAWGIVSLFLWAFFLLCVIGIHKTDALLAACFLAILVFLAAKYSLLTWFKPSRVTPWILFLVCFASRLAYCAYMMPMITQVSDFQANLELAATKAWVGSLYYEVFSHCATYAVFLRFLHLFTQESALFFQCLLLAGIPPILYRIGTRIHNETLGLLAAGTYLVWPGLFAYSIIVTSECIASLACVAVFALILDIYYAVVKEKRGLTRSVILKIVGAGLLCGVCALVRDYAIIILIAATLCGLLLLFGQKRYEKRQILVAIALLLACRMASATGLSFLLNQTSGLPLTDYTVQAHMYWSLDPDGWGGWSQEGASDFFELLAQHDNNIGAGAREAVKFRFEVLKSEWQRIPDLLFRKGQSSYGDNNDSLFYWAFDQTLREEYRQPLFSGCQIWRTSERYFYQGTILCLLLCTIYRKREIFFILLITAGSIAAQFPIECQGRYKCVIEPIWCVAVAWALYSLVKKARKASDKWSEMSQ